MQKKYSIIIYLIYKIILKSLKKIDPVKKDNENQLSD